VLDLPHTGGSLANEALSQANIACVLTDYSIYSARTLLRIVRHIEGRAHPPTVHVLANQSRAADKGGVQQRDFAKAIELPIALNIPFDARGPMLAENLGEPLAERCEFARSIAQLSGLLTGAESAADTEQRGGLFTRLRRRA